MGEVSSPYAVVLTTVASAEDAERIAGKLLDDQLAAGVQMLSIKSLYTWKNARVDADEVLLLIMTREELYPELEQAIVAVHKYETPEILLLPVEKGLPSYLSWIDALTRRRRD